MEQDQPVSETLASNIRMLMGRPGAPKTQEAVAVAAGVDQTTVSRMLTKTNSPTLEKVERVARAFAVKPWQLLLPNFNPDLVCRDALGPMALELGCLYESLDAAQQATLYAVAEALHNPAQPAPQPGVVPRPAPQRAR